MLDSAWEGLLIVLSWPNILYPICGTLLSMAFAFIPGISGVTLMALAIPWTFQWEPLQVVLLFGAMVGGGTFMGSVTAILFNIPGSAPNAATTLDGYPMALKGEAMTAIACAASASALGSTVGIGLLIAMIPLLSQLILAVGPLEMLLLAIWGLSTIVMLSRRTPLKGAITAGLGLAIGMVGLDPRTGESRFTFGLHYLIEGVPLVPALLGVFGLAEMIELFASGRRTVADRDPHLPLSGSVREGLMAVVRYPWLFLRSSLIGMGIGVMPGVGGTVAGFVAYGDAARRDPEGRFGKGDIRGVLAPEAAHDAKDGGALVPMLAFGIPGSEGTALLLTALLLHGVTPGRELLDSQLTLVFVLIWSLFISNWLTSIVGLAVTRPLARLTVVPVHLMVPVIVVVLVMAALAYAGNFADLAVTAAFGVVGFAMKAYGWPRVAFVIALVLAGVFEDNLFLSLRLFELGRLNPLDRPLALALAALMVVTVWWPRRQLLMSRGRKSEA
jgi:putative tricarboxylic transport membrane protein